MSIADIDTAISFTGLTLKQRIKFLFNNTLPIGSIQLDIFDKVSGTYSEEYKKVIYKCK